MRPCVKKPREVKKVNYQPEIQPQFCSLHATFRSVLFWSFRVSIFSSRDSDAPGIICPFNISLCRSTIFLSFHHFCLLTLVNYFQFFALVAFMPNILPHSKIFSRLLLFCFCFIQCWGINPRGSYYLSVTICEGPGSEMGIRARLLFSISTSIESAVSWGPGQNKALPKFQTLEHL